MASPLAGLASTIHGALKGIFFDATMTIEVVPASPAYDPADPPAPVPVSYPCKALRDKYSRFDKSNSSILEGDSKILILVNSLSVQPVRNGIVTIQGSSFNIVNFDADPVNAVWTIQGRQ